MNTDTAFPSILRELYGEFAEHLLSLPETATVEGAVAWLGERVLFGLPDAIAYAARSSSFVHPEDSIAGAISLFSFPDTDMNEIGTFYRYMISAQAKLESAGLPGFSRIDEVRQLYTDE